MKEVNAYIFGGTFDPIHQGHVGVIREVLSSKRAVVLAPTRQNPWKEQEATSIELRFEMISMVLAAESIPQSSTPETGSVYVSDIDYAYVAEFVGSWRERFSGQIHWVVGPDLVNEVEKWKDWDKLEISTYVAGLHGEGARSTDVRTVTAEPHPAIAGFVKQRRLYR